MWTIEKENDVSYDDELYTVWWVITDGTRTFRTDTEEEAKWLQEVLTFDKELS